MGREKRLRIGVESIEEQIRKHEQKILEYEGKNVYVIDYWNKDIQRLKREKEKKERKLGAA